MLVAKYKYDSSIYTDLLPEFSSDFGGYTVDDEGGITDLWVAGNNANGSLGINSVANPSVFTNLIGSPTYADLKDVDIISCGEGHTFIIKTDGTLWACGDNQYGQLGLGTTTQFFYNFNRVDIDDVKDIKCGRNHTLVLKNDNTLWACGDNQYGQLGLGNTTDQTSFVKVMDDVQKLPSELKGSFSVVLKTDGTLWSCGQNTYGGLGLNNTTDTTSFTQVVTNSYGVKDIYCSFLATLIVKNDGTIWVTGQNGHGELGMGDVERLITLAQITTNVDNILKVFCGTNHFIFLKNDYTVWATGYNVDGQLGLGDNTDRTTITQVDIDNVKDINCGYHNTLVLKNDNTLWTCGGNTFGQLGLNNNISSCNTFTQLMDYADNIESISVGWNHAFVLKTDKTIHGCGDNQYGQLGLGDALNRNFLYPVTTNFDNLFLKDIAKVYNGENYTIILRNDGTLWTCGYNEYGQLGLGDIINRTTFTQVPNVTNVKEVFCGSQNSFIIKTDDTVWATGHNLYGQLGLGDKVHRYTYTQVTTNVSDFKKIACGHQHTLMLKNNGTVWSCGRNNYGQLGLGTTTTTYTTFTETTTNDGNVVDIACGYYHSSELLSSGIVYTCGRNNCGQLGLGNINNKTTFTQVSNVTNVKEVFCGSQNSFIIKTDDTVWACGYNSTGQLGLGNTDSKTSFTQVTTNVSDVKDIVCGYSNTFIIKNDGTVWACGENGSYQLGIEGNETAQTKFTQVNVVDKVKDISVGSATTFFLNDEGDLAAIGTNDFGQLGVNDMANRTSLTKVTMCTPIIGFNDIKKVSLGEYSTYLLKTDGTLWVCGDNTIGQLGIGGTTDATTFVRVPYMNDIKDIYTCFDSVYTLKTDGTLWACGDNQYGELGLGDTTNRSFFTQITTNTENIKEVYCGGYHIFLLKTDGTLWACGDNQYGQLGLGNTTNRNTFTQVTENVDNIKYITTQGNHVGLFKNDNTIWFTGRNIFGQLGFGDTGDATNRTTFTQNVVENVDVKDIICGYNHTFLVKSDGSLVACGYNTFGQLGLGDTTDRKTFTQVTTNVSDIKKILCGARSSLILKNDGTLWATGYSAEDQFGLGTATNQNSFVQIASDIDCIKEVSSRGYHTFILREEGIVTRTIESEDIPSYIKFGSTVNTLVKQSLLEVLNISLKDFTNSRNMFSNCTSLTSLNLEGIDLSMLQDVDNMIDGCISLNSITVNNTSITTINSLITHLPLRSKGDLGILSIKGRVTLTDIDKITAESLFWEVRFEHIDVLRYKFNSSIDTLPTFNNDFEYIIIDDIREDGTSVRTIQSPSLPSSISFSDCVGLIGLDLLNITNIINMDEMFNNCTSLSILNISTWDTSKVESMYRMFNNTPNLTDIGMLNCNVKTIQDIANALTDETNRTLWYLDADISTYQDVNGVTLKKYMEDSSTLYLNNPLLKGDTIEIVDRVLSHVHRYNKVIIDNSYTWKVVEFEGICPIYEVTIQDLNISPSGRILCNVATERNPSTDKEGYWAIFKGDSNDTIRLQCPFTLEQLESFIQTNPITIVYTLEEPIIENIGHLQNDIVIRAYKDGVIEVNTGKVLPSKVTVKYKTSIPNIIRIEENLQTIQDNQSSSTNYDSIVNDIINE